MSAMRQASGVTERYTKRTSMLMVFAAALFDVHQTLGHLPGTFPRILGHEPVGEIVAVAPDVTTPKVGDRVGSAWIQSTRGRCELCQRGHKIFCPYMKGTGGDQGGHAEYMAMNADATYLIPDKVSYERAPTTLEGFDQRQRYRHRTA